MADSEMMLAYIGKVLGQMGAALGGNQQNLVNFGNQAAATNENTLADIQRKKAAEEEQKKKDKGIWGDILNIGGDIASVAFPELAPVIQPVTKIASGGISGGTEGALNAGINQAIPIVGDTVAKSVTPSAPAQQPKAPIAPVPVTAPTEEQMMQKQAQTAPPLVPSQGEAISPEPSGKTLSATGETAKNIFSQVLSNPSFQQSAAHLVNTLTAPEPFVPNTVGMSPDTAFALNQELNQKAQQQKQWEYQQLERSDRQQQNATQNQFEAQKIQIAQDAAKAKGANIKTLSTKPMKQADGTYTIPAIVGGNVANIPVSGVPIETQRNEQLANIGGVNVPLAEYNAEVQRLQAANPDATPYEIMQQLAYENAGELAKVRPQLPAIAIQDGQVVTVPRTPQGIGTPEVARIPLSDTQQAASDEKKAASERAAVDQKEQLKNIALKKAEDVGAATFQVEEGRGKIKVFKKDVEDFKTVIESLIDEDIKTFNGQVGTLVSTPTEITNSAGQKGMMFEWKSPDGTVKSKTLTGLQYLEGE